MSKNTRISNLDTLIEDGHEVQTTIFDLGSSQIRLSSKSDLSLISVSGRYSPSLAKEIDKVALRCHGSVGLEFKEIHRDPRSPTPRSFDSSVLSLLKNMRMRCERRGEVFFLCAPPPKLEDMLKLAGVYEAYQIVDKTGDVVGKPAVSSQHGRHGRQPAMQPVEAHKERARKRIVQLNQSLKRTVSLEKGLDSAEKCVKKLLPEKPPVAEGYGFAFSYKSSEKIGGDFFDFIDLGDNKMGISLGDVSGHGIDAALVMGISKKLINIRARDPRLQTPSAVLRQVNADVTYDLNRQTFVTALYGTLDLTTSTFCYARAGHEFPILFFPGGKQTVLRSKGVALGLTREQFFVSQLEDVTVHLAPGQCLLMCTDGLAECRNSRAAIFTRERLAFELGQLGRTGTSCQELLDHILSTILAFAGDHPQEDDMTAILVQRLPGPTAGKKIPLSLKPSSPPEVQ